MLIRQNPDQLLMGAWFVAVAAELKPPQQGLTGPFCARSRGERRCHCASRIRPLSRATASPSLSLPKPIHSRRQYQQKQPKPRARSIPHGLAPAGPTLICPSYKLIGGGVGLGLLLGSSILCSVLLAVPVFACADSHLAPVGGWCRVLWLAP